MDHVGVKEKCHVNDSDYADSLDEYYHMKRILHKMFAEGDLVQKVSVEYCSTPRQKFMMGLELFLCAYESVLTHKSFMHLSKIQLLIEYVLSMSPSNAQNER